MAFGTSSSTRRTDLLADLEALREVATPVYEESGVTVLKLES